MISSSLVVYYFLRRAKHLRQAAANADNQAEEPRQVAGVLRLLEIERGAYVDEGIKKQQDFLGSKCNLTLKLYTFYRFGVSKQTGENKVVYRSFR